MNRNNKDEKIELVLSIIQNCLEIKEILSHELNYISKEKKTING